MLKQESLLLAVSIGTRNCGRRILEESDGIPTPAEPDSSPFSMPLTSYSCCYDEDQSLHELLQTIYEESERPLPAAVAHRAGA